MRHNLLTLCACSLLWATQTAHATPVYRCGSSYSATPCAAGQQPLHSTAATHATGTAKHTANASDTRTATTGRAAARKALKAQRAARQPARQSAHALQTTQRQLRDTPLAPTGKQKNTTANRCDAAQRRVDQIDTLARRGGTAQQTEYLRDQRQQARDAQFAARC